MALQDVGIWNPAESHYSRPGSYEDMLRGEAAKRAAYLSSMDQFYENLAEIQRQFGETLAFKKETRDLELTFARERAAAEDKYRSELLGLEREKLRLTRTTSTSGWDERKLYERYLDLLEKGMTTQRDIGLEYLRGNVGVGGLWEGPGVEAEKADRRRRQEEMRSGEVRVY